MKKAFFKVVFSNMILYALQYLIVPLIYKKVFYATNEGIAVIAVTTIIITGIGMVIFSDKMRLWLLGIVAYAGLIVVYCPKRAYGIGLVGLDLDGMHSSYSHSDRFVKIAIIVGFVIVLQLLVWCFVKVVKAIAKLRR